MVSLLLMADAFKKGDDKDFQRLLARHLSEVDDQNADLCYRYAMLLIS